MKSLFLTDIQKPELLRSALSQVLIGQIDPWLLSDTMGDPIAYFSIMQTENTQEVQADISGRHYHSDKAVTAVLEEIKLIVGGHIHRDENA